MRRAGQLRMGLLLVASVVALAVCVLAGAQSYEVTDLGSGADPRAINNSGWVAGCQGDEACVWAVTANGVEKTVVGTGEAEDINDLGQVVGCLNLNDGWGMTEGRLWRRDGAGWSVTILPPLDGGTRSWAAEINDDGLIVGYACSTPPGSGEVYQAVVWQIEAGGTVTGPVALPVPEGHSSRACAVNNAGWVVGGTAPVGGSWAICVWKPDAQGGWSSPQPIGVGGWWVDAVNDGGQIVGTIQYEGDVRRPFLYDETSGLRDLGKMGPFPDAIGTDVNEATQIVGTGIVFDINWPYNHWDRAAFIWQNGEYTDFSHLLAGYNLEWSYGMGINDRGQIVCSGGSADPAYSGGVILSPPGTLPAAPVADAGGPYGATTVPGTITFDGSGSHDPDGLIASYLWDFGDGSPTDEGPALVQPQHTYLAAGSYTATLLVMDNDGYTGMDTAAVTIGTPPTIRVASVLVTAQMGVNKKWQATATVTVLDASDAPVSGATVSGVWSGAYTGTSSGVTDASGQVALTSGLVKPGTFTFTVTNVTHPNAVWNGVPASATITAP